MSPEFDFSGDFVNSENCDEEAILTIVGQPIAQEKEANQMVVVDGVERKKKYLVLNMLVEYDGKRKTYTPDKDTGRRFQAHWGRDHSQWVGKQFKAHLETYLSYGVQKKRVAGYPLE